MVVQRDVSHIRSVQNTKYKGLYRTPPWSQSAFDDGFNDPIVFGNLTDKAGLIRDLVAANNVLERFAEVYQRANLEILWTRSHDAEIPPPPHFRRLGTDIACKAPFWSILADMPAGPLADWALVRVNDNGLFDDVETALMYLSRYRAEHPEHREIDLFVWEVYQPGATPGDD